MKHVVSLSLGSSRRDKTVRAVLEGEEFEIRREGVDGDQQRFVRRLAELDGTVDAIGFGGMDRYLWSDGRRYEFPAAARLLAGAVRTPVLDGSGLKNTLEREAVERLASEGAIDFKRSRTLVVSGVDRFGMGEAIAAQGGEVVFGDLLFGLGLPFPIRGITALRRVAKVLLPVVLRMPISMLYPTGEKQDAIEPKHESWYRWADTIAGDFLYIRRLLPTAESGALVGKTILTNTTTAADHEELRSRGVARLITTTPVFDGRSFGTNVMEAMLVALEGRRLDEAGYRDWIHRLGWVPRIVDLRHG
ncbi:MAG: quinate 5-dehydrogenase [Armatimonadota bacterium]